MAEAVVLGDLELDQVLALSIEEQRKVVVHPWPGGDGDLVQDLGAAAARGRLAGVAVGENAGDRLEQLRALMQEGLPVEFAASAAVGSDIEEVLITGLRVHQPPGRVNYYEYRLELIRYVPPPPPAGPFDAGALADISEAVRQAAADNLGPFTEALGKPAAALAAVDDLMSLAEDVLEGAEQLAEIQAVLDKAGKVIRSWTG